MDCRGGRAVRRSAARPLPVPPWPGRAGARPSHVSVPAGTRFVGSIASVRDRAEVEAGLEPATRDPQSRALPLSDSTKPSDAGRTRVAVRTPGTRIGWRAPPDDVRRNGAWNAGVLVGSCGTPAKRLGTGHARAPVAGGSGPAMSETARGSQDEEASRGRAGEASCHRGSPQRFGLARGGEWRRATRPGRRRTRVPARAGTDARASADRPTRYGEPPGVWHDGLGAGRDGIMAVLEKAAQGSGDFAIVKRPAAAPDPCLSRQRVRSRGRRGALGDQRPQAALRAPPVQPEHRADQPVGHTRPERAVREGQERHGHRHDADGA